jgi:hypothetical protein
MSALFCLPIAFTASTSGSFPASNTNIDQPGMIFRGTSLTVTFASQSIDTVAIIGNQTGTVSLSGGVTASKAAFTGAKDPSVTTKTVFNFGAITASTITITFASSCDIQRVIIGKSVITDGIDIAAEQTFEDPSVFTSGPGYVGVDVYPTLPSWRIRCSWISDAQWRSEFWPLFVKAGVSKAVLFLRDYEDATTHQHEATFGRLSVPAKGTHNNHNNWVVETTLTSLTP